jgi:hypothetical protein
VSARIRRLRSLIERPADIWLICRMTAWAVVLPLLKHVVRLEGLARLMWSEGEPKGRPATAKIVRLSRLLTRPTARMRGGCYERSLLAYRFLSQHGADPRLVVAVRRDAGTVAGHAWVTIGGIPVDPSEALEGFVPVAVYGAGGRAEE